MELPHEAINWKTIYNVNDYETLSDNPILKKDDHHAEIIDIVDGLVVDDNPLMHYDADDYDYEPIDNTDLCSAFSKVDWSKTF